VYSDVLFFKNLVYCDKYNPNSLAMENLSQQSIETIIVKNFKAAKIFKRHQIDCYLRRTSTLHKACQLAGIDEIHLERELAEMLQEEHLPVPDYANFPLDALSNHIEEKFHRYIYDQIPVFISRFTDISNLYGESHPAIFPIRDQFLQLANELSNHIIRQESILFPAIVSMAKVSRTKLAHHPFLGDVHVAVSKGKLESKSNLLNEIIESISNYIQLLPACELLQNTADSLEELEKNLYLHFYLETNVLFPKALQLEEMIIQHHQAVS
jgi:regulator of cell morphogenesis and NO signaling